MDLLDFHKHFAAVAGDKARAEYLLAHFRNQSLSAKNDAVGNVWLGEGDLVLAAHMDTVLVPHPPVRQDGRLGGPAVGDNSAGVAVLAILAEEQPPGVIFAFTVGEEGTGNLRGARALVEETSPRAFVAVDGYLGNLVDRALGSVRYNVTFKGVGGHSWGDRGTPSATHALGVSVDHLYALELPVQASLNVGRVWGGSAVNVVAAEAGFSLDLRASQPDTLEQLEDQVRVSMMASAQSVGVKLELELLGRRPAGGRPDLALVSAAQAALEADGIQPQREAGSTDAAAAVEKGIPAIALGVYLGGGAHSEEEWVEQNSLSIGLRVLRRFLASYLGGVRG